MKYFHYLFNADIACGVIKKVNKNGPYFKKYIRQNQKCGNKIKASLI